MVYYGTQHAMRLKQYAVTLGVLIKYDYKVAMKQSRFQECLFTKSIYYLTSFRACI